MWEVAQVSWWFMPLRKSRICCFDVADSKTPPHLYHTLCDTSTWRHLSNLKHLVQWWPMTLQHEKVPPVHILKIRSIWDKSIGQFFCTPPPLSSKFQTSSITQNSGRVSPPPPTRIYICHVSASEQAKALYCECTQALSRGQISVFCFHHLLVQKVQTS